MLLSIGIPAYNASKDLDRVLSSIYEESVSFEFEVLVVDDGSSDDSVSMIEKNYNQVRLFAQSENQGVAAATDVILEHMTGEYLLRLDADTVVDMKIVEKMIKKMEEEEDIGVLAPRLIGLDGGFQESYVKHFKQPYEWFWDYLLWPTKAFRKLNPAQLSNDEIENGFEITFVISAIILMRSSAAKEAGGIDKEIEFFMDDSDWIVRIARNGWKILYWPKVSMVHVGGQSGTLYIHTRDRSLKNLYYFYDKFLPGKHNHIQLKSAVLFGSAISLVLALVASPMLLLGGRSREIVLRGIKSFGNVFAWHLR